MKLLSSLALLGLGLALPFAMDERPDLGESAVELSGVDAAGDPVRLTDRAQQPVVLYFLSSTTRDCREALEQLAQELGRAKGAEGIEVLAITASADDADLVASTLGTHGTHVISADRADMKAYDVIAFPTAFVLDGDHRVVSIVRGHGVLAGFKIATAVRFASGAIDRAQYEDLLGGDRPAITSKGSQRYSHMLRKLVLEGRLGAAATALAVKDPGERAPTESLLLLRLQLASGDVEAARATRATIEPDPELAALDIELMILAGELEPAAAALADLTVRQSPRGRYLEALLLRARGDDEAAAMLDRETVQVLMVLGDSDR